MTDLNNEIKIIYKNYLINKYKFDNENYLISNIDTIKLTNGQSNEIFLCILNDDFNQINHIDSKDIKVIIRIFGSELTGSGNNLKIDNLKEKLIYEKIRFQFQLPEILYSFPKGRIEEFFKLQDIGLDEFKNLSDQIANIISKIHSLNLDDILKKNDNHLETIVDNLYNSYLENLANFDNLEFEDNNIKKKFQILIRFDFKKLVDWVKMIEKKLKSKIVFNHNDINRTNFHWLDCSDNLERKLILIDFEYANYGFRWTDLSNYLLELTVEKAIGSENSDDFFPEDEFCTNFLMTYLNCLKENDDYEFDEVFDNLDRLRLEVDFGCIVINLIRCLWILSHQKITKSKFNFSENAYLRLNLMNSLYYQFKDKYKNLEF